MLTIFGGEKNSDMSSLSLNSLLTSVPFNFKALAPFGISDSK